jgi:predicted amidophosphoribosyltransferase
MDAPLWERIALRRCRWCGNDDVGEDIWVRINRDTLACRRCAARALRSPPQLAAVVAAYRGRGQAVRAVIAYKEREAGWESLEAPLAAALHESVAEAIDIYGLPEDALIVPVPSYRDRRPHVRRLTSFLPDVVTDLDILHKQHDVRQTGAGRRQRWEQSLGAYRVRWPSRVRWLSHLRGSTIVVTDDVYTTGATLNACAAALRAAGAKEVYGATILRTVSPPPACAVAVLPHAAAPHPLQINVRYTVPNGKGMVGCQAGTGRIWVRFGCEPGCPYVLTAGPFALPTPHMDVATHWLCPCGTSHEIQIARIGAHLRVTVPPRHPAELLVALHFPPP